MGSVATFDCLFKYKLCVYNHMCSCYSSVGEQPTDVALLYKNSV